jgi:peptide/nickel transport system substrate-binding protein
VEQQSYWRNVLHRPTNRRRALAGAGALTLSAAFLAACGGDSGDQAKSSSSNSLLVKPKDTTKEAKRGGTYKFYTSSDSVTFDVHAAATGGAGFGPVYGQLLQYKSGYLKPQEYDIEPHLAESWEWSPDRLSLAMKLRQDVKWHNKAPVNGRSLDMEDVLFSWQRYSTKSGSRSTLAASADPAAPVLSVTSPDPRTVVFKLQYPAIDMLALLASTSFLLTIVPKESDTSFDMRRDMIGTGPFVLTNHTPSVGFTFKRNAEYFRKDQPLLDQIDMPIVPEYAAGLAQFKAGNVYQFDVKSEDILGQKREAPKIDVYQGEFANFVMKTGFGWLPAGKSPFFDERVRQALSMSYDRDAWLDVFMNVSQFESQGLPVETRWATHLNPSFVGWWLDPKSKEFGPNAKYYQRNIPEAKKLMAAAGYATGLDVVSNYISGTQYGNDFQRMIQVLEQMASEAGFRSKPNLLDYNLEFIPKFRDSQGKFEGWQYKKGTPSANEAVSQLAKEYYSKGAPAGFWGFDLNGKGDFSGDPNLDVQFEKARSEIDTERRRSIIHDVQRYLAQKMYAVHWPGGASGFLMAWPALRNFNVYQGGRDVDQRFHLWIDETQPPLRLA